MAKTTAISWCDSTVNPVVGCPGCELGEDCYARRMCARYGMRPGWPDDFGWPILKWTVMAEAYRWPDLTGTARPDKPWINGAPRLIFVGDLGDVFGASVVGPGRHAFADWIVGELTRMAASPHVFLLLTKWPEVAKDMLRGKQCPANVWLGVSVCDASTVHRIETLREVEVWHRFVSFEPLRGDMPGELDLRGINWAIVGGQSGKNWEKSMKYDWSAWCGWAEHIRTVCDQDGVPYFFKQKPGARPGEGPLLFGREYRGMPAALTKRG